MSDQTILHHNPHAVVVGSTHIPALRWAHAPRLAPDIASLALQWHDCAAGPIRQRSDDDSCLLFDFGRKIAGHLLLARTTCDVTLHLNHGPVLGLLRFGGDVVVPAGDGQWRDMEFRAFRYLRLWSHAPLPSPEVSVPILEWTAVTPPDHSHRFVCSDDELNRIWSVGAYTAQLCTQPHHLSSCYMAQLPPHLQSFVREFQSPYGEHVVWDGPRRDREVWVGDLWPEAFTLLYGLGEVDPLRASLHLISTIPNDDGSLPGSGVTRQRFSEYACWWAVLVERLHFFTGDREFLDRVAPALQRLLHWLLDHLAANDGWLVIGERQTWAWTLSRQGVVTGTQCVAYAALVAGQNLLPVLADQSLADACARAALTLRAKISAHLWRPTPGVFRDCLVPADGVERVSCDSNALAVLLGVADTAQTSACLQYLATHMWGPYGTRTIDPVEPPSKWNWAHCHNVWPFVVGLELEARFIAGQHSSAMDLLRRCWGNMVRQGSECFWEMVGGDDGKFVTHRRVADTGHDGDTWDSYCHGWSAAPTYLLQAYVLGLRPLAPAFTRCLFDPSLGDLDWIHGSVPTPRGEIAASISRSQSSITINLTVPPGTVVVQANGQEFGPGSHTWQEKDRS